MPFPSVYGLGATASTTVRFNTYQAVDEHNQLARRNTR